MSHNQVNPNIVRVSYCSGANIRVKTNSHGFTLMEVLFAVFIMGLSLVTIIGLEIKTIRLQHVSNRTTVATLLAQQMMVQKMQEIREETAPSFYFEEGEFEEEDYEGYFWEFEVVTTPAEDLYRINLMVYWDEDDKKGNSVSLSSFIYSETS